MWNVHKNQVMTNFRSFWLANLHFLSQLSCTCPCNLRQTFELRATFAQISAETSRMKKANLQKSGSSYWNNNQTAKHPVYLVQYIQSSISLLIALGAYNYQSATRRWCLPPLKKCVGAAKWKSFLQQQKGPCKNSLEIQDTKISIAT